MSRKLQAYRNEMVMRVIPNDLAYSYILPSTSLDTALVHSDECRQFGMSPRLIIRDTHHRG